MATRRKKKAPPPSPLRRIELGLTLQQRAAVDRFVTAVWTIDRGVGAKDYRRPSVQGGIGGHPEVRSDDSRALVAYVQQRCEPELWGLAEAMLIQRPLPQNTRGRPPGGKELGRRIRKVAHEGIAAGIADGAMWGAAIRISRLVCSFEAERLHAVERAATPRKVEGGSSLAAIMGIRVERSGRVPI